MSANAYPSKTFFVDMLTRDIELKDAILDLLDNCVDGILREQKHKAPKNPKLPYDGYWAKLEVSPKFFSIEDNCGGISKDIAEKSAFRLGRADLGRDEDLATVGMYGIGMKRAIFKMGRKAQVISKHKKDTYRVTIPSKWLKDDNDWELPLEDMPADSLENDGTRIVVETLYDNIERQLDGKDFEKDLYDDISNFFALIMMKGFKVLLNEREIPLADFRLLFSSDFDTPNQIQPYAYRAKINDVAIEMVIGFYRGLASVSEAEKDEEAEKNLPSRKSDNAGWTVICNDRVILYRDKTRMTGWGVRDVPKYHTQFVAISGVIRFTSTNSLNLPLGTTKTQLDTSSPVYERALERMMDGLKKFTSFTNKWKGLERETAETFNKMESVDSSVIVKNIPAPKWTKVRGAQGDEEKFIPDLPEPPKASSLRRIAFYKLLSEIDELKDYFFGESEATSSEIGERSFDEALKIARGDK